MEKRHDYAEAGMMEYWIVDPQAEKITVLSLAGDRYLESGVYGRGETASSPLLVGFAIESTQCSTPIN